METISPETESKWRRFILATILFLVYELVVIVFFGEYFFTGVASEAGVWMMVAAAATGYLLLGLLSGSWLSIFVIGIPLVFVLALDPPVHPDAWGSERLPLTGVWFMLSVIFLPAWGLGTLIASLVPENSVPDMDPKD